MDNREFPRFAVELPISFSGDEVAGGGIVSSLSKEGCTVHSDENVQPGTYLVLHIHLSEQYSPLRIELAVVRWTTGGELGLEFLRMASQERQRLFHILKSLEPGPPNSHRGFMGASRNSPI